MIAAFLRYRQQQVYLQSTRPDETTYLQALAEASLKTAEAVGLQQEIGLISQKKADLQTNFLKQKEMMQLALKGRKDRRRGLDEHSGSESNGGGSSHATTTEQNRLHNKRLSKQEHKEFLLRMENLSKERKKHLEESAKRAEEQKLEHLKLEQQKLEKLREQKHNLIKKRMIEKQKQRQKFQQQWKAQQQDLKALFKTIQVVDKTRKEKYELIERALLNQQLIEREKNRTIRKQLMAKLDWTQINQHQSRYDEILKKKQHQKLEQMRKKAKFSIKSEREQLSQQIEDDKQKQRVKLLQKTQRIKKFMDSVRQKAKSQRHPPAKLNQDNKTVAANVVIPKKSAEIRKLGNDYLKQACVFSQEIKRQRQKRMEFISAKRRIIQTQTISKESNSTNSKQRARGSHSIRLSYDKKHTEMEDEQTQNQSNKQQGRQKMSRNLNELKLKSALEKKVKDEYQRKLNLLMLSESFDKKAQWRQQEVKCLGQKQSQKAQALMKQYEQSVISSVQTKLALLGLNKEK